MASEDYKNHKNIKGISALKMVLPYIMPYKLQLIGAAIALLFAAVTVLAMGAGLRFLIDEGFAETLEEAQKIMSDLKPELVEEVYQNQLKKILK